MKTLAELEALKERFYLDPEPGRLGALAADLARVASAGAHPEHGSLVYHLVDESRYFIEWMVPSCILDTQVFLLDIQRELTRWYHTWDCLWPDEEKRRQMRDQAKAWSLLLLERSGLLKG